MSTRVVTRTMTLLLIGMLVLSACTSTSVAQVPLNSQLPANATLVPLPDDVSGAQLLALQQQALIDLYQRANPSVVNIRVVGQQSALTLETPQLPDIPGLPQLPQLPDQGPSQGLGSGFVYDTEGHIVTNNHVVDGADKIVVTFTDGSEVEATLVGADPDSDLAVIKIDADAAHLSPVTLGRSDDLQVGQTVIAIGNPFGLEGSMTTGIVSGLGRLLPAGTQTIAGRSFSIPDMIQSDAAINPGNSGGPLFDLSGNLVGVNTAIESPVRASSGVGYAVPSDIVQQVVPQLIADGKVEHAWLGISGLTLNSDLARAMNLDANQHGVLIATVDAEGPAAKAGLLGSSQEATIDGQTVTVGGDVIVAINDQPVDEFDNLLTYIVRQAKVGESVTLRVLRAGEQQDIDVTLEARP